MEDYLEHLESVLGSETIKTMLLEFKSDSVKVLDDLIQSVEALNKKDIVAYAHELKGMSLNVGAETLAELSLEIENIARTSTKTELAQNDFIYSIISDITDEIETINEFISSKV